MSICKRCGAEFSCGMTDVNGEDPCWCTQIQALPRTAYVGSNTNEGSPSCFCPQCLRALVAMQQKSATDGQ
ncbi:cysteine-rich CWC family protein [Herbaspirillum sp. GCM10030257]|uniref:cysteine-rich CWC family protein n=1 Tax=Herbaspirillum sp. GCM10030257 TaxID=3273393 RepID=UPI00361A8FE1